MTYESKEANTERIICPQCERLHIKSHVYHGQCMIIEKVNFYDENGEKQFYDKAQRDYFDCSNFHKWYIDREIK